MDVVLTNKNGSTQVFIDGMQIKGVTSVDFNQDVEVGRPKLTLEMWVDNLNFDIDKQKNWQKF